MNKDDITNLIRVVSIVGWAVVIYYQLRKYKKNSKADYNHFMKTVGISGIIGFLIFFALAALWSQTPIKTGSITGLIGLMLGILVGMLVDKKIRNHKQTNKRHSK